MRILLLNPNTSQSVTDRITAAARAVAGPGTELIPVTAPRGVPYIATRAEATIGGAVALELLAELQGRYDVAVIAAFGDPGLGGARELFPVPVIGLAEAGMLTACMLGRSFAIVTFSQSLEPW
jgi:Asp/Glu/hydantoin racemase